jgi:hypothetical protein
MLKLISPSHPAYIASYSIAESYLPRVVPTPDTLLTRRTMSRTCSVCPAALTGTEGSLNPAPPRPHPGTTIRPVRLDNAQRPPTARRQRIQHILQIHQRRVRPVEWVEAKPKHVLVHRRDFTRGHQRPELVLSQLQVLAIVNVNHDALGLAMLIATTSMTPAWAEGSEME